MKKAALIAGILGAVIIGSLVWWKTPRTVITAAKTGRELF